LFHSENRYGDHILPLNYCGNSTTCSNIMMIIKTREQTLSLLPFPQKLHALLDACKRQGETSIVWCPGGCSFQVTHKEHFAERVMPVFFRSNNYKTVSPKTVGSSSGIHYRLSHYPALQFQRNLNLWGFRVQAHGFSIYCHEFFQEGKSGLCHQITRSRLAPSDRRKRTQSQGIEQVHTSRPVLPTAMMNLSTSTIHVPAYNTACTTMSSRSDLHLLSQLGADASSPANNHLILEERVRSELVALPDMAIASRPNQIETVTNQGRSYVADGPQYQPALNSQWRQPAFLKSQCLGNVVNSQYIHAPQGVRVNPAIFSIMSEGRDYNFPEPSNTTTLRQDIVQGTPAWWISSELLPVVIDHPTTTATTTTIEVLKKRKRTDDDHGLSSHHVPSVTHRRWM